MPKGNPTSSGSPKEPQKRKLSSSSSEDFSPASEKIKQDKKRVYHQISDSLEEEEEENSMAVQAAIEDMKKQFQHLATKDDIKEYKSEMEKLVNSLTNKMEILEGRFFEVEKQADAVRSEISVVKRENKELKEKLKRQEQRTQQVLSDLNDQQQYDRRWNLRVYNVAEEDGETTVDCAAKCCHVFTDLIGVPTTEADLEAAHRTGPIVRGRKRPIIVRFMSRKLKDKVLADRKKLKNKGVSVDEDLTPANYKMAREAYRHSYTLASWSSQGKVFAKLKNNKTVRLRVGDNVDEIFKKEMPVGP